MSRITPTPLTALRPSPEAVPAAVSPPPADRRWRVDVGCGWPRSELRRQDFAGHADELVDRRVGQGVPLGAGRVVLVELLEQPAVGHRVRFVQAATWTSASRTLCPMSASLPAAPMMQSVLRRQKSDACDTPGCLIWIVKYCKTDIYLLARDTQSMGCIYYVQCDMQSLSDHIALDEILTSGELAARLTTTGLSAAAARQVISRNNDPAVRVLPFRLPHRARLFTRRTSVQNESFYLRLADVMIKVRPGVARTIVALLKRRILPRADAHRLLAAPLTPKSSRTPTYDAEVKALTDLGLCYVEDSTMALERLTFNSIVGLPKSHQLARSERARQIVAMFFTRMITDQCRRQGVISWTGTTLPDGTGAVMFNDHVFSAIGYSWLDPLMRRAVGQKPKPTPVLFDVYARECDVQDVLGFVHRLAHIGSNRNARMPVLGVLAAYAFSGDAWSVAKARGLLAINLRQSYGDAALAMLAKMEHLLHLADAGDWFGEHAAEIDYEELANDVDVLRVTAVPQNF